MNLRRVALAIPPSHLQSIVPMIYSSISLVVVRAAASSAWRVSQLSHSRMLHCASAAGNERHASRIQIVLSYNVP